MYPDWQSALKPVLHNLGITVPFPPPISDIKNEKTYKSIVSSAESNADEMFVANTYEKNSHLLSQLELNNLVQDLFLFKEKVELLSSTVQDYNNGIYFKGILKFHHSIVTLQSYLHFTRLKIEYAINLTFGRVDHVAKEQRLFMNSIKASL